MRWEYESRIIVKGKTMMRWMGDLSRKNRTPTVIRLLTFTTVVVLDFGAYDLFKNISCRIKLCSCSVYSQSERKQGKPFIDSHMILNKMSQCCEQQTHRFWLQANWYVIFLVSCPNNDKGLLLKYSWFFFYYDRFWASPQIVYLLSKSRNPVHLLLLIGVFQPKPPMNL